MLSVVIPAYNEQETVAAAAEEISRVLCEAQISHELVFVDDGSKDGTWQTICTQAVRLPRVHGVRFSRNFGKEAAIFAGLGQATASRREERQERPQKQIRCQTFRQPHLRIPNRIITFSTDCAAWPR